MKTTARIAALVFFASGLLASCSYVPPQEGTSHVASRDYMASGRVENVRAYVYAKTTLVELSGPAKFFIVRDENSQPVSYEQTGSNGQYYRLSRLLDTFTVWINGRSVTFTASPTSRVYAMQRSAMLAKAEPKPVTQTAVADTPVPPAPPVAATSDMAKSAGGSDDDVMAQIRLCEAQLNEVHRLIVKNQTHASAKDIATVNRRLDEIEARMITAATALVRVNFPTGGTEFKPSAQVARVLVAAGKAADKVNVRGRTDAKVAGPVDAKIALGRALAARKFFVTNGVGAEKIRVFSLAGGDFLAPDNTAQGKAINRRVDIEFVNARIAQIKSQSIRLTSAR